MRYPPETQMLAFAVVVLITVMLGGCAFLMVMSQ